MKRFITMCLAALMIVSCVSVVAGAAVADWNIGNGAPLVALDGTILEEHSPVTVTDTADGMQIMHGGYYLSGADWAGVVSKDKYDIDGLEFTIRFDVLPEVTAEDDCWILLNLLEKDFMYYHTDVPKNRGFMNLIRFGRGYIEVYNGVDIFTLSYNSQEDNPDYFLLKSGDIVNIKFEYVTSPVPGYKATLTVNDKTPFVLPYIAENIVDVFPDGKAHIAIDCNLKGSKENEFTYTLTDLKNGTEKTQEQIDAVAGLREAAAKEAKKADVLKKSESARKRVEAALETAKNANVAEAIAKAEEGVAALEAFNAAVEAENYDEAQTHLTFAGDCAKESGKLVRAAEKAEREQQAATGETKEEANENVEVVEEESSSNVGLIIAIIVIAVIVIAAVIVIVLKKKKN